MAVELLTYHDCVQHLSDVFQFSDATVMGRRARIAVDSVYRDLPYKINWKYYQRRQTFETVASYSTGTAAYDHTGGAHERLVTLSGTVPTWAQFGRFILNDVTYRIAEYKSTTTFTLFEDDNPGEDVSATTFTIYRNEYPVPHDFRRGMRIYDVADEQEIPIVGFGESQRLLVGIDREPDQPRRAYIRNSGDYYGVWTIEMIPPPSAARTYDISYEGKPRDILTVSYSTGTVATSSTTVTGTTTVFPASCVGSVIRFGVSASSTAVTNKFGSNPFTEQRVIAARGGDTSLTIDTAPTSAYSAGTGYMISDPIDIHPGAMTTAFLRAIEAEFAKVCAFKDVGERMALAQQALMQAMENEPNDTYANAAPMYEPRTTWANES